MSENPDFDMVECPECGGYNVRVRGEDGEITGEVLWFECTCGDCGEEWWIGAAVDEEWDERYS